MGDRTNHRDENGRKIGSSEKSSWVDGRAVHRDNSGHKIGHSEAAMFDASATNTYDSSGRKVGTSRPGALNPERTNHYDRDGKKIGYSLPATFGNGRVYYDTNGRKLGTSDGRSPGSETLYSSSTNRQFPGSSWDTDSVADRILSRSGSVDDILNGDHFYGGGLGSKRALSTNGFARAVWGVGHGIIGGFYVLLYGCAFHVLGVMIRWGLGTTDNPTNHGFYPWGWSGMAGAFLTVTGGLPLFESIHPSDPLHKYRIVPAIVGAPFLLFGIWLYSQELHGFSYSY